MISGRIYKQQPRQTHDPVPQPSPGGQDIPVWIITTTCANSNVMNGQCSRSTKDTSGDHWIPSNSKKELTLPAPVIQRNGLKLHPSSSEYSSKMEYFVRDVPTGRSSDYHFLKYVTRVLKKFPLTDEYPAEFTPATITSWIEKQLIYVRDVIQPSLSNRGAEERREHPRAVSREKLSYLWQHRKSNTIDIILNNSTFPSMTPVTCINIIWPNVNHPLLNQ